MQRGGLACGGWYKYKECRVGWGVGLRYATDEDGIKFSDRLALSEVTKLEDAKLPYRSLAMTIH